MELLPDTFTLEYLLVHLEHLNEQSRDALVALDINKRHVKVQYDNSVCPRRFSEGDLVLLSDQARETLGGRKV